METRKLNCTETLKESLEIGIKNAPSLIAAVLLWVLTIWIPYLNVGTTIAMSMLPVELAKGGIINPLSIFDSKYRRYMGEYFITAGIMTVASFVGVIFAFVPAVVLSLAWSLAYYFLIERGMNPMQAIKASNDATYGSKKAMFLVLFIYSFCCSLAVTILGLLFRYFDSTAGMVLISLLLIACILFILSTAMGLNASIWRQLKDNVE